MSQCDDDKASDSGSKSQCDDDKSSDPDSKCLTLEDISAAGVSNAAEGSRLKDFLLLRKDLLPVCHDSSECTEDNASLEANYGDESSCCVSDVSSLSFQNAVLDDPEYNSGYPPSQTTGERSSVGSDWIGNDLQDASELSETVSELPDEPPEICDEVAEKGDSGDSTKDLICDQDRINDVDHDENVQKNPRFHESCDVAGDTDKIADRCQGDTTVTVETSGVHSGQEFRLAERGTSPRKTEDGEEVTKKDISREKGGRNSEQISSAKSQQPLKNSPGLARRMLSREGKTVSSSRQSSGSPQGQRQNDDVIDSEISSNDGATGGGDRQEKRFEDQEKTDVSDVQEVTSKDRDEQLKDQEKREKIAHIDALYKRQIEALMQNQVDDESVDSSGSVTAKADIENEYNYVKYARVQDKELYFGLQVAHDNDQHEVGKRLSSVSDHSLDGKQSAQEMSIIEKHLSKQVAEPEEQELPGFAELSLNATEIDSGDKSISCHMPSVEDGLSSGHASDCEETVSSRHDMSPAEVLKSRQRAEVVSRPDSLPSSLVSEKDSDAPAVLPDDSSRTRQTDVELAIQDIKSAIEKSKKVKLISPSAANDDQSKQVSDNGREPVWITRKEHKKDLPRQLPKNSNETTSNDSTKSPKAAETDEDEDDEQTKKAHAPTKDDLSSLGTQSMIRRHNKKYMSLPSGDNSSIDNERDGDDDDAQESSTTASSRNGIRISSNHPETIATKSTTAQNHSTMITGNGYATAVGQEPLDQIRSSRGTYAKTDLSAGKAVASEVAGTDLGITTSKQVEEHASKHSECTCMEKSDEDTDKPASRPVEGEYSTDEETDELLNKQYTRSEKVEIPELSSSPVNRSQSERRQNRAREVALRDPTNETVLIEGVLFRANYLGSTQLISEGQPSKGMRMMQAQEAVGRIKAPDGETQPSTEVDLFVSVEKIMVLNTDLQEIMMDHALRTISYIADIGDILVIMARRGPIMNQSSDASTRRRSQTKICCHVFESDEAQLIAQSIGQAFQVSYMEFLKANGIDNPSHIRELDYQEVLNQQEIFGEELYLFSNREMQKEVIVPKVKGEPLGVVIVESGWGSMVPTVVLANMSPTGAAARCGQLNIGDQIMSINGISLVGLPLSTCQNYIKVARHQSVVKLAVVSCAPVVEVLIKRPDIKYQLGFSVQNGVICSLLRGGIAERGGIRVGHRIIEINGQSVVAISHDKIVHMLATSVGEIQMKTMPTSIFRLLTGQDVPHYI